MGPRITGRSFRGGRRPRLVVPGFTRTGGFYGRFGIGGELKFHDVDINDAVVAAGGTIAANTVHVIQQGVTEKQRIGRKCTIRSINWRFNISLPEVDALATPNPSDTIRVILYLDKQANGAAAGVQDILEFDDFQSFNNLANKSRFRTLMDRTYDMNYTTLSSDGAGVSSSASYEINDTLFKKVNLPIEFDSTTGAIGEIKSNNIAVLLVGKNGVAGFASKMRLRFSDN